MQNTGMLKEDLKYDTNGSEVREGRTWSTSTVPQQKVQVRETRSWTTTSNTSNPRAIAKQGMHPVNKLKRIPTQNRLKLNLATQGTFGSASSVNGEDKDDRLKRRESLYFGKSIRTAMWWLYRRPEETSPSTSDFLTIENTYRLEPKPGCKFLASKVENVLRDIVATHGAKDFLKLDMVSEGAGDFVQFLAESIKIRVKSLEFDRYRIITHIQMGTSSTHDLLIASRCLWNVDTDTYVTATIRAGKTFVVLTVYGVYLD